MKYLEKYNMSDEDILDIINLLECAKVDTDIFKYNSNKVKKILNLFVNIGVTNIKEIIISHPYLFCDTFNSIKKRIDDYDNKEELAKLINDDASNLKLIGIN